MLINVRTNAKEVAKRMEQAGSRQIPFAFSRAINDTLFDIRKELVRETYPSAFPTAPNKAFPRASLRIEKASKVDLQGSVYDRFGFNWVERQAVGGEKLPKTSRTLAIPLYKNKKTGETNFRRTTRGPAKARRAGAVMKKPKRYFSGKPRGSKKGQVNIWERVGRKGREGLRLVYVYEKHAPVKKAFTGYEDAQSIVRQEFNRNFKKRLNEALSSAKRGRH